MHGESKLLGNVQDMDLQRHKKLRWTYIEQFSAMFKELSPENICNDAEFVFPLVDNTGYLIQPSAGEYVLLAL